MKNLLKNLKTNFSRNKSTLIITCVIWIILVLYPNPIIIFLNIGRSINLPIDTSSVHDISLKLPNNATFIDEYLDKTMNYSYDWQVYDVPWYFPTPKEVLEKGRGDCKAKAVVLASILKDKGIDYTIDFSPIHVWVDYEGKVMDEFKIKYESGKFPSLDVWFNSYKEMLWDSMPFMRKILLFAGLFFIVFIFLFYHRYWPSGLRKKTARKFYPKILFVSTGFGRE